MTETNPSAAHYIPAPQVLPVTGGFVRRLGRFGTGLLIAAGLCVCTALYIQYKTGVQQNRQLQQIQTIGLLLQKELATLNSPTPGFPEFRSLQTLLGLGQEVSNNAQSYSWYGQLYSQKLQFLLTQAIETLSRPVSGIDSTDTERARQERAIRLETQTQLQALQQHLDTASNGLLILLYCLAFVLMLSGMILLHQWRLYGNTNRLSLRIHALSRALHTQEQSDNKREGATTALEGVIQIGRQLQELNNSGRTVLQFAKSFHQLSSQGTHAAKVVLNSEQRNQKADSHLETMKEQLEGLRSDIRSAAQGLRKAGEVSRQLINRLDGSQMELTLNEPDKSVELQKMVEQSQQALKEAIEGLVMASQKINMSQLESNKLAEFMAVNQASWSNLLDQIEQYSDSASSDSQKALVLAKKLMQTQLEK